MGGLNGGGTITGLTSGGHSRSGTGAVAGAAMIRGSSFVGNHALPPTSSGGAIFDLASEGLDLINCTFTGNSVSGAGWEQRGWALPWGRCVRRKVQLLGAV